MNKIQVISHMAIRHRFIAFCLGFFLPACIQAQIAFQGVVFEPDGAIPPDRIASARFSLWSDSLEGEELWVEQQNIRIEQGQYSFVLGGDGSVKELMPRQLWLQHQLDGEQQGERMRIFTVPQAWNSHTVSDSILAGTVFPDSQMVRSINGMQDSVVFSAGYALDVTQSDTGSIQLELDTSLTDLRYLRKDKSQRFLKDLEVMGGLDVGGNLDVGGDLTAKSIKTPGKEEYYRYSAADFNLLERSEKGWKKTYDGLQLECGDSQVWVPLRASLNLPFSDGRYVDSVLVFASFSGNPDVWVHVSVETRDATGLVTKLGGDVEGGKNVFQYIPNGWNDVKPGYTYSEGYAVETQLMDNSQFITRVVLQTGSRGTGTCKTGERVNVVLEDILVKLKQK